MRADLEDEFSFTLSSTDANGDWTVTLQYFIPEIVSDPRGYTTDSYSFSI